MSGFGCHSLSRARSHLAEPLRLDFLVAIVDYPGLEAVDVIKQLDAATSLGRAVAGSGEPKASAGSGNPRGKSPESTSGDRPRSTAGGTRPGSAGMSNNMSQRPPGTECCTPTTFNRERSRGSRMALIGRWQGQGR